MDLRVSEFFKKGQDEESGSDLFYSDRLLKKSEIGIKLVPMRCRFRSRGTKSSEMRLKIGLNLRIRSEYSSDLYSNSNSKLGPINIRNNVCMYCGWIQKSGSDLRSEGVHAVRVD